ncbi:MAG: helix-turn-helix domain-containing protein [Muribaculaceae bacterium]|nr:helix-turn-helix domain-containing protein [Muribaculaceae bacterium]
MSQMKYTSIEALEDKILGKVGTPRRDAFEIEVNKEIQAYHVGEAIRMARLNKNMTQQQLGELMGVKKAQVSRIENGQSFSLATIIRAFKAMGLHTNLEVEGGIKVALW